MADQKIDVGGLTAMRNIRQNLVFDFAYHAIGIPVAAGVPYPTFGILLSPVSQPWRCR